MTFLIDHQFVVRTRLNYDAATQEDNVVEIFQERDAVCDENSRFSREKTVWSDDLV